MRATEPAKHRSRPVHRLVEFERLRLARTRFRFEVVNPTYKRREAHENRFRTAARLQTKDCPSVIKQVELDITPAAVKLVLTFPLAIRLIHPAFYDWKICIEKRIANVLDEKECLLEITLQIIEE